MSDNAQTPEVTSTPEVSARAPIHSDEILGKADPRLQEYVENMAAERAQLRLKEKAAQDARRAVEAQLAELKTIREAEEASRLAEQGKYKELYEQMQSKVAELTQAQAQTAIQSAVSTELLKQGAVDPDIADLLLKHHKDVIQFKDGVAFGVTEAVEQFKQNKPALFKSTAPAMPAAAPVVTTGLPGATPQPGNAPAFNSRTASPEEAEAYWKDLLNGLNGRR